MEEPEEGEILDIDEDEEVYTPLERPALTEPLHQPPQRLAESESDESPESSTDSDSSSEPCSAKKRKVHRQKPPHQSRRDGPPAGCSKYNRRYNIWTASLQEEAITRELEELNGLENFSRDRGVESYDFTRARVEDEDSSIDEYYTEIKNLNISEDEQTDLRLKLSNKRRFEDRGHVKQRLGRRTSPPDACANKNEELCQARMILDLTKSLSDSSEDLAKDMANKLLEEKEELILRVVNILGKEKAIAMFKETQRVEAQGGMLIMNGSRRRSPGGVFLFILKVDHTVTHDQKNEIFEDDVKQARRRRLKLRVRKMERYLDERSKLGIDEVRSPTPDFPDLLSRAELAVQQAMAKNAKASDGSVINPPPSPATDNRGESSNDSPPHRPPVESSDSRTVTDYQLDFLDVYGEGMDEF